MGGRRHPSEADHLPAALVANVDAVLRAPRGLAQYVVAPAEQLAVLVPVLGLARAVRAVAQLLRTARPRGRRVGRCADPTGLSRQRGGVGGGVARVGRARVAARVEGDLHGDLEGGHGVPLLRRGA